MDPIFAQCFSDDEVIYNPTQDERSPKIFVTSWLILNLALFVSFFQTDKFIISGLSDLYYTKPV